ncbi:MAG: hypothetical protein HY736_01960 [Verrucomicrobia bacterium]|nr:hypothetical protein [Verrucomicrobiota bacterium]
MQRIYLTALSPEEYIATEAHRQVTADIVCPRCGKGRLQRHGKYGRGITGLLGQLLWLLVARFICGVCDHTVSYLPNFALSYLQQRLAEVGIHTTPFEPAAETLLLQSARGIPRTLNALLQRSMEQAALANRRAVTSGDVQFALDTLPWLARARPTG